MSSTEPSTNSSNVSESNSNGKRERAEDEKNAEEPSMKMLRSSDDSDENKEEMSDTRSSADVTPVPEGEKTVEVAAGGGQKTAAGTTSTSNPGTPAVAAEPAASVSTETTKEEESAAAAPEEEAEPAIQIDRSGEDVKTEDTAKEEEGETAPAAPGSDPRAGDPRSSATTTTPAAAAPTTATAAPAGVDPNARATVTNPDQMIEERGEVSALYVGRVIGKGGEMIRDLQARSGARIDVDQNVPAGQPRVITYRGTRETVDFAKQLVHMLSVQGIHENDLPLGRASQEILVIPSMSVGKVIGRGGEMIRELQSRSQAKIQIDHSGVSGMPPDQKQVTITGTADSVTKAKEMVLFLVANPMCDAQQSLNLLIDDKVRGGGRWGSGPPYTNLPNHGTNMQPQMLPQPNQGYNYPPGGYGQPQGYGAPMGGPQYPPQQPPALQGGYPPVAQAAYGMPGGRETDVVYAQKQYMGRIIGSKGMTVNDLQRRSGCDIQINQDVPHGQDCEITIKGSREGIESVKNMIKEIIEVGPQHPYAGGMDSGYGGGGGGYQPQQQQQGAYGQQYPYQQQQGGYGQAGDYGQSAYGMPMGGGYGQPQAAAAPAMGGGGGYHGAQQQQPQYGGYPSQQPVAPPMQAAAASPWKAATAPDGQVYYYNERSGETQWEKPAGMP